MVLEIELAVAETSLALGRQAVEGTECNAMVPLRALHLAQKMVTRG